MAASAPPAGAAGAEGVEHQLSDLVAKYPSDDRQRQALHAALLADVTSADAWACVLQHEVRRGLSSTDLHGVSTATCGTVFDG
jgi:hypothetical protein